MPAENPLGGFLDDEVVQRVYDRGLPTGSGEVEMMRRLKDAVQASERSANALGYRIWWLNFWLLLFTIAIFGLTAVVVGIELHVIGGAR
jgi:hypothetical protein